MYGGSFTEREPKNGKREIHIFRQRKAFSQKEKKNNKPDIPAKPT